VVNELLASRGLTTIRRPGSGIFSVVSVGEAPGLVEPRAWTETEAEVAGANVIRPGFEAVLVPVEHLDMKEAERLVGPLLSRAGSLSAGPGPRLVLVADYSERVERVAKTLRAADQPGEPFVIREFTAAQLTPDELATSVADLAKRRASATGAQLRGEVGPAPSGAGVLIMAPSPELPAWEELIRLADQREQTVTRTYGIEHDSVASAADLVEAVLAEGVQRERGGRRERRVVADTLTGSLIVTATPRRHERIAEIVDRLNTRDPRRRRVIRVFPVRNRSVQEVTQLLSQLVSAGVLVSDASAAAAKETGRADDAGAPPSNSAVSSAPSGALPGLGGLEPAEPPDVVLTPDASTNRLIAVGEPRLLDELEPLIEQLDVRQPQVMLEVVIVSLNESLTRDLGVELEKIVIDGSTVIRLSSLFGLGAVDPLDATQPARAGIGFGGSVLDPREYSLVVRALETVSEGRILSKPRVLVGNNQQATFNSVLQEPFASVNASDTVATTSFGGTQDAGTNISIRPQIAEADHIVLQYSVSLSSFVGESSNAALPPPRQQNSVQSFVTIPDGHAVVVGGFEITTMGDGESRVPGLGTVPLFGELFKSRSKSNSRARFYVFIRADVLRRDGFDSLRAYSDESLLEAAVDDGWPVVKPEIMR
jgi:general secretion pathway protein D